MAKISSFLHLFYVSQRIKEKTLIGKIIKMHRFSNLHVYCILFLRLSCLVVFMDNARSTAILNNNLKLGFLRHKSATEIIVSHVKGSEWITQYSKTLSEETGKLERWLWICSLTSCLWAEIGQFTAYMQSNLRSKQNRGIISYIKKEDNLFPEISRGTNHQTTARHSAIQRMAVVGL